MVRGSVLERVAAQEKEGIGSTKGAQKYVSLVAHTELVRQGDNLLGGTSADPNLLKPSTKNGTKRAKKDPRNERLNLKPPSLAA